MMDQLHGATGILTAVLDLDGNVLTASGWRSICLEFHRKHEKSKKCCSISDRSINKWLQDDQKYVIYHCDNGLMDAATRVMVLGDHVANVYTGQFLLEAPDLAFFSRQAREYGFDEKAYLEALNQVPVCNEEQIKNIMEYLCTKAEMLGETGYKEI